MESVVDECKIKVAIEKKLLSSENKEFKIGSDIHFTLCRNAKEYSCFGVIKEIEDRWLEITKVEIDKMRLRDELNVGFDEVKDGIIHFTDNGWY